MKLIVDTCVWSLWLRRRSQSLLNANEQQTLTELREAVENRRATILGPIRQEILSGIRDAAQFAKAAGLLDPFLDEPIEPSDYIEAAKFFNRKFPAEDVRISSGLNHLALFVPLCECLHGD